MFSSEHTTLARMTERPDAELSVAELGGLALAGQAAALIAAGPQEPTLVQLPSSSSAQCVPPARAPSHWVTVSLSVCLCVSLCLCLPVCF